MTYIRFRLEALTILLIVPLIDVHPQYSTSSRYEAEPTANYTISPDVKLRTSIPENQQTDGSVVLRQFGNVYRFPSRQQQLSQSELFQPNQQTHSQLQPLPYQEPQTYDAQYGQPSRNQTQAQPYQPHNYHHQRHQPLSPFEESSKQHHTRAFIPIIKVDKSQALDGSYKQSWETGNNIIAEESGYLKNVGVKDQKTTLVQQGTYTFTAPDGTVVTTTYTADEAGFRVEGSHLSTRPPIPQEIGKGLEQIYEGIRLQQDVNVREGRVADKYKTGSYEENFINPDNYPQQYQQQQQQQQYHQHQQQQQQHQQHLLQHYQQQQQQQRQKIQQQLLYEEGQQQQQQHYQLQDKEIIRKHSEAYRRRGQNASHQSSKQQQ